MRKAKEGHVGVTTPKYGFRYNEARDGLIVCEPEMKVVEKVFRMAAEGLGVTAIRTRLRSEGIPSPKERYGTLACCGTWWRVTSTDHTLTRRSWGRLRRRWQRD